MNYENIRDRIWINIRNNFGILTQFQVEYAFDKKREHSSEMKKLYSTYHNKMDLLDFILTLSNTSKNSQEYEAVAEAVCLMAFMIEKDMKKLKQNQRSWLLDFISQIN